MSKLKQQLRRFHAALQESRRTNEPVDEVFGRREEAYWKLVTHSLERSAGREPERALARECSIEASEGPISRRALLVGGAALGGSVLLARRTASATAPRIAVVGAGFAGLTAAYRIWKLSGWVPDVYEAQQRVGGRARTIRSLAAGQYTEAGPSGINSNDKAIHNLCAELGLTPLVDTWLHAPSGSDVYLFSGSFYTWSQLKPGFTDIADAGWRAWNRIGRHIPTYRQHNTAAIEYDSMSATEFLRTETGYGPSTPAGQFTVNDFGVEYGGRASDASAIQQILEQGTIWGGGSYDERYAVPGGNDRLARALANRLPAGALHFDRALTAIRRNSNGTYTLTFQRGQSVQDVVADRVVLAIPPTMLREVDTTSAQFGVVKQREFKQEGMGTNTKLNLQFAGRPWVDNKRSGDAVTDLVTQSVWQVSHQGINPALLVAMNNHDYGKLPAHGLMPPTVLARTLQALDTIFPGASAKLIGGQAYLDCWPNDPWVRGSYAYNRVGGFISYEGVQDERRGNVHFAGEHTARYVQSGTMNGAVESGERTAREVTSY